MKSTLVYALPSSSLTKRRRKAGFTLVELLTVIAIIVLLVGITIGILGHAQRTAARKKASGQLQLLVTGLVSYEKLYGEYPEPIDNSGKGSGGSKALYQALSGDGNNFLVIRSEEGGTPSDGIVGSEGEFLVEGLDPKGNKHGLINTEYALVDPYGQLWRYRVYDKNDDDLTNNRTYDLWSLADDRQGKNEAKWIKNW